MSVFHYVNERIITNVLSGCVLTLTFVNDLLIQIRQKEKIELEFAVKVASVNGRLEK